MRFTFLGTIILILQIYFAIHAYRQGKLFWIFIIIFFPLIGLAVYFFVEFLPGFRLDRTLSNVQNAGGTLVNNLQPERRLQQLEETLAEFDTIANRQAYASQLLQLERVDEAIEVLEGGLRGVFADDAQALFLLAQAYAQQDNFAKAQDILERIQDDNPSFSPEAVRLLRAQMLEQQGQVVEAIGEYEAIARRGINEEARYRLVLALDGQGEHDAANRIYQEALKYMKNSSALYRRENQPWIRLLKQHVEAKSR